MRNIAWTGTHFYVSDNDNNIKQVNMDTRKVEQTIDISEYARHLTYSAALNNGKGGFVVGDWETSIITSADGSKLADGPALLGASGTACVGNTLYAFEQGGKANAHTLGVYDLTTGKRTSTIDLDEYLELTDIEGSVAGGASVIDNGNGTQLLALALQRKSGKTRFVFLAQRDLPCIASRVNRHAHWQWMTSRSWAESVPSLAITSIATAPC